MSKKSDAKRKERRDKQRAGRMRKWKACVVKAREIWRQRERAKRKRRFREGKQVAAHLSGYWDQVFSIARQIFGGPKP